MARRKAGGLPLLGTVAKITVPGPKAPKKKKAKKPRHNPYGRAWNEKEIPRAQRTGSTTLKKGDTATLTRGGHTQTMRVLDQRAPFRGSVEVVVLRTDKRPGKKPKKAVYPIDNRRLEEEFADRKAGGGSFWRKRGEDEY